MRVRPARRENELGEKARHGPGYLAFVRVALHVRTAANILVYIFIPLKAAEKENRPSQRK